MVLYTLNCIQAEGDGFIRVRGVLIETLGADVRREHRF